MSKLFEEEASTLSVWMDLLNWECWPDFGNCHELVATGELEEFYQRYLVSSELQDFSNNLAFKLKNKKNNSSSWVLISGNPGIGKTTFLYALIAHVEIDPALREKYVFSVCHANNVSGENWKLEIFRHVKRALKKLYIECSQTDAFDRICCSGDDSESSLDTQIRDLKNFMFKEGNKNFFPKTLVFVVDNVDTVMDEERIISSFELINTIIEPSGIKKWIAIRPETLSRYSKPGRVRMKSFVRENMNMPVISFYDVVCKRIDNSSGGNDNPLNPFNKELCDEFIFPLCDENMRKSFDVLEKILEFVPPKGFAGKTINDSSVIANYFRNRLTRTLNEAGELVDLHKQVYRTKEIESPIIYDLLKLVPFSASSNALFAMLHDATARRNTVIGYKITGRDSTFKISATEFKESLRILNDLNMIRWDQTEDTITITQKGNALCNLATAQHYAEVCKENPDTNRSSIYWEAANVDVSHAALVRNFATSRII